MLPPYGGDAGLTRLAVAGKCPLSRAQVFTSNGQVGRKAGADSCLNSISRHSRVLPAISSSFVSISELPYDLAVSSQSGHARMISHSSITPLLRSNVAIAAAVEPEVKMSSAITKRWKALSWPHGL